MLRLTEPQIVDPAALVLFCDAWPPASAQRIFLRSGKRPRGVPTLDLTIHFRHTLPRDPAPDAFYLGVFRSQAAREGFVEEDGEIWSRDGVLLAQSRQLAVLS